VDPGHTVIANAIRIHAVLQFEASSRGVKKSLGKHQDSIKMFVASTGA
jgi:hypothetical protein